MANRFTDSRKWDDPWFRKLPCKYKSFWIFLLDKCDHAGIWKVDFESATFHIGEPIEAQEIKDVLEGRIYEYRDKWFIPKFIFFQYGMLSELNRVHKSVLEILEKEGLYKVYTQTLEGLKDKDKDKDKEKRVVKGEKNSSLEIYNHYAKTIKPGAREDALRNITKLLKTDLTKDVLLARIDAYKAQLDKSQTDKQYYIQANNFFGRAARYKDFELQEPKYKSVNPNCKLCRGSGFVYIQATNSNRVCDCRIIKKP